METSMGNKSFMSNKLKMQLKPWLFLAPAIIILGAVILYPVFKVFQYSVVENMIYTDTPAFIGLENYKAVLTDSRFISMLKFTPLFVLGSVALHIVIGLFFAVKLNSDINPHVLSAFRVLFVLPWVFTAAVVAVVWQLMLSTQGVVNELLTMASGSRVLIEWLGTPTTAVLSLLFINAWRGYPTCMVSFLAGLQNIPQEMYEAADVDGASKFRQFFSLTLPQLKPVIWSVGVLDGIWTMNLFPLIWLTTGGGPFSATESIATLTYRLSFVEFQFGQASALAVIGLCITMIGIVFYMRSQKNAAD